MKIRTLLLAAILLATACSREPAQAPPEKQWTVKGRIVQVQAPERTVRIDHQDIPGLMTAMTMTFPVESEQVLEGVAAGDAVEFTLAQTDSGLLVQRIRKIDPALLQSADEPKIHQGRATVVVVNPKVAGVLIRHEGIGEIPPGELMLSVDPPTLLEGIDDGMQVEITLTRYPDRLVVTGLKKAE